MPSAIVTSFVGALQASLSVVLVIFYGVVAAQYNLLDNESAKKVSHLSVKLFLPFLLITNVGRELSLSNGYNYVPILIWSIFYNVVSLVIGLVCVKLFKLPPWVTPAITFNNTTSLPLLLIQSMESTGILNAILQDNEDVKSAISRAQSYFLVCAVISNCATFAVGPRLLDGDERREDNDDKEEDDGAEQGQSHGNTNGNASAWSGDGMQQQHRNEPYAEPGHDENADETTSLLPERVIAAHTRLHSQVHDRTHNLLHQHHIHPDDFSPRTKSFWSVIADFLNPPLIGAIFGFILGLVPPLHKAFFSDSDQGGIFTAWLTQSLRNTGELFVSLQVILVGVKLSSSLRKMKRGEGHRSGNMPWSATLFVFGIRYVFWPVVSIPTIYGLAKAGVLDNDAILWFTMMIMPSGPPAMSLIPMADVSGKDEGIKMCVAKLLTGMYALSPVLAFVVTIALKAAQQVSESS